MLFNNPSRNFDVNESVTETKNLKSSGNLLILTCLLAIISACQGSKNLISYEIAYSSKEGDRGRIYLANREGTSNIKIADHPENIGYVAWAPNGKSIAFYGYYDGRKTWSIHSMSVDGANRKRLTHRKNAWDNSPTWSPDGSKIAFARAYRDSATVWQYEIWIMNSDGSDQQQINGLVGGGPYFISDNRILFHSQSGKSEICIADVDGSNLIQLTHNDAEDWHPEISPDGRQVAFMSDREGQKAIYTMNVDGSDQKRLTSLEAESWYPSWSPDGTEIMFTCQTGEDKGIYIMKKDGSSVRKVVEKGSQPAWLKIHR